MKISRRCDYAIRALIYLASQSESKKYIHIEEIANRQNIPIKFLAIILLEMKKWNLLSSKKGPGGGYELKCDPAKVSLFALIEMIDGKVNEYEIDLSVKTTDETLNAASVLKHNLGAVAKTTQQAAGSISLQQMRDHYIKLQYEDDDYEI